jgi:uncharacterized protein (TIGR00251 family)
LKFNILVQVIAGAKVSGIVGFDDAQCLKIKVQVPAQDGRANLAVIALLSQYFKIPKQAIAITHGLKQSRKLICIDHPEWSLERLLEM